MKDCSSNHTSPYPFTLYVWLVLMVTPFHFKVMNSYVVRTLFKMLLLHNSSTMYWLSSSSMFLRYNSWRPPTLQKPNYANALSSFSLASLSVYCKDWMYFFRFPFVFLRFFHVSSSCTFRYFICHCISPLFVLTVGPIVSLLATLMIDGFFSYCHYLNNCYFLCLSEKIQLHLLFVQSPLDSSSCTN